MIAHLTDRAVVAVEGEGARAFLHNLLTQDVETLAAGELRYAALLTPQGRLLHDMLLLGTETGVLIDVAASAREDLIHRLTLYRLRAKVTIASCDRQVWACWDQAGEDAWPADPRTSALGFRLIGASDQSPPEDDVADYDTHRVTLGVPDAARDGLSDRAYPIEVNLDLLNAIDFKKGCFVGQETTSRMHRRGTVKTRLLPLAVNGATAGAEVLAGTLRAGEVTYALAHKALALLRLDRIGGAALTVADCPARVAPPAWFPSLVA